MLMRLLVFRKPLALRLGHLNFIVNTFKDSIGNMCFNKVYNTREVCFLPFWQRP